ncbi:hypothetical protein DES53_113122 [Roseimicrobium gellanilyticum]|uniref:Uncharacterized protein n=1 Tax=Roseimicrobium gellanilyticum TaxID=748857 RepID=A0A366H6J7_9BACT|nr:hypothetical protein DES53_113122 [Roseimicrobium gellanilyticum]
MHGSSQSAASMVVFLDEGADPGIEDQYKSETISLSVIADASCWASITLR